MPDGSNVLAFPKAVTASSLVVENDAILFEAKRSSVHMADGTIIPDHYAIFRTYEHPDDPAICEYAPLGVVSGRYAIVQNGDIDKAVREAVASAVPDRFLGNVTVKDRESRNGAFSQREYCFNDLVLPVKQKYGNTELIFRCGWRNSFDGSSPVVGFAGSYDLICTNGMIGNMLNLIGKKHTANFTTKKISDFVEGQVERFTEQVRMFQQWADKEVTREAVEATIKALPGMSVRLAEKMMGQFDVEAQKRGPTVWALYSAFTHYASHPETFAIRNTGLDTTGEVLAIREGHTETWAASQPFQMLMAA